MLMMLKLSLRAAKLREVYLYIPKFVQTLSLNRQLDVIYFTMQKRQLSVYNLNLREQYRLLGCLSSQ
jgi:hypothetical protein